jgi:hypothetical protein
VADNVTLPGTGMDVATDDIGGKHVQRIKPQHGVDGEAVDTSTVNPFPVQLLGEALEALEACRVYLQALTRTIGQTLPDTAGRQRVLIDAISASLTLATVTTVGTVTTVSTVTSVTTLANQTNIGGVAAVEHIPSLMRVASGCTRQLISVT